MHAADEILLNVRRVTESRTRPVVVALDGGSGSGKSTLAGVVQQLTGAALVQLDDFYTTSVPEADWPQRSVEKRLRDVFDWERVRRQALEPLRDGRSARWHAFDFLSGRKRQAPGFMQRAGMEWLFRLATEPRRLWRRYLSQNPRFLVLFGLQLARARLGQRPRTEQPLHGS